MFMYFSRGLKQMEVLGFEFEGDQEEANQIGGSRFGPTPHAGRLYYHGLYGTRCLGGDGPPRLSKCRPYNRHRMSR